MALRYALLALLRVGPLSGYDLAKVFHESVGHVWHAPDSQIYPELRKMEAEGLVEGEEELRGERRKRRLYRVTEAGDQAFRDWLAAPVDYQRIRDPAHLRAAYLEAASPEAARAFLEGHRAQWASELERWENELERIRTLANPILVRRLEAMPDGDRDRTIAYKLFAYEGLVARARTEIEWAERGLALVASLDG